MTAMRDYGPRDKRARTIATINGWLLLCVLTPGLMLLGVHWFLENPSVSSFLAGLAVPIAIGAISLQAIRYGRGLI